MISLITGASSGIGRDFAIELAKKNYDLIIVARNEEKLNEVKEEIEKKYKVKVEAIKCDISDEEQVKKLYEDVKQKYTNIDLLINNAGFGTCGRFVETDLDKEIKMIKTNVIGSQILTKLFLKDMVKANKGYILNVASIAGFMPGPLMATYYSTKAYVVRLTQSIRMELFMMHSKVKISALCPGPVRTNFNKVADVKFSIPGQSSKYVVKYALFKIKLHKTLIFPSLGIWLYRIIVKILPDQISGFINYFMQRRKIQ